MQKFQVKVNDLYPNNTADHFIELTEGEYEGLHFNFGPIEFAGEDEQGNGKINFDYNLLNLPEGISFEGEHKTEIENIISIVLKQIIEQMLENSNNEAADETGNTNTEQSTEG